MSKNFENVIERIFELEGGYVNHPNDKGGATNMGITKAVLTAWRKQLVSIEDMQNLTKEEAKEIYKKNYWDALNLDRIENELVAYVIFDQAVNCGIYASGVRSQRVINEMKIKNNGFPLLVVDGVIGPKSLEAISKADPKEFVPRFIQESQVYYIDIVVKNPSQLVFLKGWTNRVGKMWEHFFKA